MNESMKFVNALSTESNLDLACQMLIDQIQHQLGSLPVHLAVVFVSPHFRAEAEQLSKRLRGELSPQVLLGCTAEGVISKNKEFEQLRAITLLAAHMPNVTLSPFLLRSMNWENMVATQEAFTQQIGAENSPQLFLLLADPFTAPMDLVLTAFNSYYPNVPVMGGMASGSMRPGGNALFANSQITNNGAIGVAVSGAVEIDVIVSQGCRPIGKALTVTNADKNMIFGLEGASPLTCLQELVEQLPESDRTLLHNGLFIGKAIAKDQNILGRGDFLIRGVMGIDRDSGAMVVGDYIAPNEVIRFHLRDASTAKEDLEMMLAPQLFFDAPSGGLLFSCNGRGTRLYNHPNGDISTIKKVVGDISMAGFFCAGEIGPIGKTNFLHGHTASLILFRPR